MIAIRSSAKYFVTNAFMQSIDPASVRVWQRDATVRVRVEFDKIDATRAYLVLDANRKIIVE